MIDRELITRKISLILKDLQPLTDLAVHSVESYLATPINEVLAERYLERMIGRMIDINYHLITESGVRRASRPQGQGCGRSPRRCLQYT